LSYKIREGGTATKNKTSLEGLNLNNIDIFAWESDVQEFYKWSIEICGVNEDTYNLLKIIVVDQHSLDKFVEYFDGHTDNLQRTIDRLLMQQVG
jgi:hypothetical protein